MCVELRKHKRVSRINSIPCFCMLSWQGFCNISTFSWCHMIPSEVKIKIIIIHPALQKAWVSFKRLGAFGHVQVIQWWFLFCSQQVLIRAYSELYLESLWFINGFQQLHHIWVTLRHTDHLSTILICCANHLQWKKTIIESIRELSTSAACNHSPRGKVYKPDVYSVSPRRKSIKKWKLQPRLGWLENQGYLPTMVTMNIKSREETTELPKSDLVQMFRLFRAVSEDAMK